MAILSLTLECLAFILCRVLLPLLGVPSPPSTFFCDPPLLIVTLCPIALTACPLSIQRILPSDLGQIHPLFTGIIQNHRYTRFPGSASWGSVCSRHVLPFHRAWDNIFFCCRCLSSTSEPGLIKPMQNLLCFQFGWLHSWVIKCIRCCLCWRNAQHLGGFVKRSLQVYVTHLRHFS